MRLIVEPFCGLGSLSRYLCKGTPAPVSRIGSKRGYAEAIARAVGLTPNAERGALLMDADEDMIRALKREAADSQKLAQAVRDSAASKVPNRPLWELCRATRYDNAASWWIWTAGARGGVGGYKGKHKLRPNVDGFIPNLSSLADRLEASDLGRYAMVLCHSVDDELDYRHSMTAHQSASFRYHSDVELVYLDPPYEDATGYTCVFVGSIADVAQRWSAEFPDAIVAVSERAPVAELVKLGWSTVNIGASRVGQSRQSLTTSHDEWLTIREGNRR